MFGVFDTPSRFLRRLTKRIWARTLLFSGGAVVTAIAASWLGPLLPVGLDLKLAAGAADHILSILASSMLAVTTFSLSIMVSAYSSASSGATPRATKLLLDDPTAQNTLSPFVGAFIFSIVGIIGLAAGVYGDNGRIILFLATIAIIAIIVATLIRWIELLGRFGRLSDTIQRVEQAAMTAIVEARNSPRLGARPIDVPPNGGMSIYLTETGYLQHIDVAGLSAFADDRQLDLYIAAMPGAFTDPTRPAIVASRTITDDDANSIREAFSVGDDRDYAQDPLFGLIVLSEIASRALSPAVNDPGTAIHIIGSGTKLLLAYAEKNRRTIRHLHASTRPIFR